MVVNVNYTSNLKNQLHTYHLIIFLKVLKSWWWLLLEKDYLSITNVNQCQFLYNEKKFEMYIFTHISDGSLRKKKLGIHF